VKRETTWGWLYTKRRQIDATLFGFACATTNKFNKQE
jgi:hypothetical protein